MHKPNGAPTSLRRRNRPALERWAISGHRSKIAIMQPVQHLLFLLQARKRNVPVAAQCRGGALLRRERVVALHEPRAHEEDVAWSDGPAGAFGADIQALPCGAGG